MLEGKILSTKIQLPVKNDSLIYFILLFFFGWFDGIGEKNIICILMNVNEMFC